MQRAGRAGLADDGNIIGRGGFFPGLKRLFRTGLLGTSTQTQTFSLPDRSPL